MSYDNILDSNMGYIYNDNKNDYNIMKGRMPNGVYATGAGYANRSGGYGFIDYSLNQETRKHQMKAPPHPQLNGDSDIDSNSDHFTSHLNPVSIHNNNNNNESGMICISNDKFNAIKKENQEFVENQSKQMLTLIDIINAYKKENELLQEQIKQNSDGNALIKQNFNIQFICLIMLLIFIMYLFYNL